MIKRLPGGRTIHFVQVSAQTEAWGPDSCTVESYNYDPVLLLVEQEDMSSPRAARRPKVAELVLTGGGRKRCKLHENAENCSK